MATFILTQLIYESEDSAIYLTNSDKLVIKLSDMSYVSTFRAAVLENLNYASLSPRIPEGIIPKYHDGFVLADGHGSRFALVLEFFPGQRLDLMKMLTPELFITLAKWIFWALNHIHWKDMVHRDITLRNILYDEIRYQFRFVDLKKMFAVAGPRAEFEDGIDFKKEDVKDASAMLLSLQDRVNFDASGRLDIIYKVLSEGLNVLNVNRPTASQMYESLQL